MPTPTKGPRIGSSPTHERAIMNGLATELFRHGKITTTQTRAKRVQPLAEQLITTAKKGLVEGGNELAARRRVIRRIEDRGVVHTLFTDIAPGFAERPGGCTRVTKIGQRRGDNAPMAVIELVTEEYSPKQQVVKEAEGTAKGAAKTEAAAEESAAEETASQESASDETASDETASEESASDETASDETASEGTAADQTAADESAGDEPAADTASGESAEEK